VTDPPHRCANPECFDEAVVGRRWCQRHRYAEDAWWARVEAVASALYARRAADDMLLLPESTTPGYLAAVRADDQHRHACAQAAVRWAYALIDEIDRRKERIEWAAPPVV
jgi:hypothetical protein